MTLPSHLPLLAYIDPGLGPLLWQIIISFFLGALFTLRKVILSAFTRRSKTSKKKEEKDLESPPSSKVS